VANNFTNNALETPEATGVPSGQRSSGVSGRLWFSELAKIPQQANEQGADAQNQIGQDAQASKADASLSGPYKLEPKLHKSQPGETIPLLARQQLGVSASSADVDKYIAQIYQVNHLKHQAKLRNDQEIMLPGCTTDGGTVLLRSNGDTETTYSGRTEIDRSDRSHILRTSMPAHDAFFEHHSGMRVEDNFNAIVSDHRLHQFTRYGDQKQLVYIDDKKVSKERERLDKLAATAITGQHQLETFRFDMAVMEDRASDWGLSHEDIIGTYKQVEELLSPHSGNKLLDDTTRTHLAQQIMSYAARPCVDQGGHNTCVEASLQARIFAMHPADAARLIKEIALKGQYVAGDGTRVELAPVPHDQSKEYPTPDNHRDFASEIFQVVAANIHYAQLNKANAENSSGAPYKTTVYEQREPIPNASPPDQGERLIETTIFSKDVTQTKELPEHAPGLTDDDSIRVSWSITGTHEPMVELAHADPSLDKLGTTKLVNEFSNEKELATYLQGLKEHPKKSMVMVRVDAMDEPLWHEYGCVAEGKDNAPHSIAVQVGADNLVLADNHWGQQHRHDIGAPLTVHQLYELSLRTNSKELVDDLTNDKSSAESGIGPGKEMDLLRHEQEAGLLKPGEFTERLEQIIDNNFVLPSGFKSLDQTSGAVYGCIVPNLSNTDRMEIKSHENKIGMIKDSDFDELFINEHVAMTRRLQLSLPKPPIPATEDALESKKMSQILEAFPQDRHDRIQSELIRQESMLAGKAVIPPFRFQFHLNLDPPPYPAPPRLLFPPLKLPNKTPIEPK
jgi:hypothetical protein